VLVIGRQGQVASALQRLAPALLPQRPLVMAGRPELDLAAPDFAERLAALLRDLQPSLVINAAAYTAVDRAESEAELAMVVNGHAVGAMSRACAQLGIPLFHLSTDYVFDGSGELPWASGTITAPLGVYGASKLLGEHLLQEAVREQGLRALVLRVSWVFGQQGANFVRTMLRLAGERDELKVVADQVGGPTSAESIARALLQLVEAAIANRHPVRGAGEPSSGGCITCRASRPPAGMALQ
jgi:dTDP-4-dehydrorhamnose reductase